MIPTSAEHEVDRAGPYYCERTNRSTDQCRTGQAMRALWFASDIHVWNSDGHTTRTRRPGCDLVGPGWQQIQMTFPA